jgi:hypothetical protein
MIVNGKHKIYMKFENEEEFLSKIQALEYDPYDERTYALWPDLAKETSETFTDGDGNEYPVMGHIPGFHVDAYLPIDADSLPDDLRSHVIPTPDNPIHRLR